jgi:hypothetical protein
MDHGQIMPNTPQMCRFFSAVGTAPLPSILLCFYSPFMLSAAARSASSAEAWPSVAICSDVITYTCLVSDDTPVGGFCKYVSGYSSASSQETRWERTFT